MLNKLAKGNGSPANAFHITKNVRKVYSKDLLAQAFLGNKRLIFFITL